ncbi:hypothetical protein DM860_007305 [Cuscuta australis]|uniref:non-specific serine/threonine protein kinase n=1 Tax=Cuscuta australis TaxID=267555 RepID=A0A328E720_9ASTE|nr:hypothetical protein DM860_007305 [Cuscuta australis]
MASHQLPSLPLKMSEGKCDKSSKYMMEARSKSYPALSSSASAQDLRCFEVEDEKDYESSPRGIIEGCIWMRENKHERSNGSQFIVPSSDSRIRSRWHRFFKLWKRNSIKRLPSFPPFASRMSRRKFKSLRENVDTSLCPLKPSLRIFTLAELKSATNNFSKENIIGSGGYAEVYKGCLPEGQFIAVKRMNRGSLEDREGNFLSEIGTIAHVDHPNTAKMIGYGVEGGIYLVLKLSSKGSLRSFLRGPRETLHWENRYKIILGISDGLLYLHENSRRRIIHRDIKADNILLTEDFVPEICDFGLAKWLPKEWTHHNISNFEGTFGYFAPEYFMHGMVDEKTDVFSFGVLLLEIITGRPAVDDSQKSIVLWAKPLLDSDEVEELVDLVLGNSYDKQQMSRVVLTASLCVEQNPILRPQMSQVVILLRDKSSDENSSKEKKKNALQRTYSEELFDAEEYNLTKYLNDLKRHQQLVLDL